MTRDKRLLLLLGLLMACGVIAVECRHRQREDAAAVTETRHRHRHRHESSTRNHRSHREPDRKSWQDVDDYEYDGDSDDPVDDSYEMYYDRPRSAHHRAVQRSYHGRMFEPRYPPRYHGGGYHAGNGWYDEDDDRRSRIIPSRYNARYHRYRTGRTHHRPVYQRDRDAMNLDDDTEEDFDYAQKSHKYESDAADKRRERWLRLRAFFRRDWRNRMNTGYRGGTRRYRPEDPSDVSRKTDDWRRRGGSNSSESPQHRFSKTDAKKSEEEEEDYEDHGGLEEDDKDEDEDEIWKDIDDDEENEEEELDNDFYKSETKPPLKTYDDIIRRLTSDDPTTPRTTVKRDYRNTETTRHTKRDGYRSLKFVEPRNASMDLFVTTNSNYFVPNRRAVQETSTVKSTGHKPPKNGAIGATVKDNDRQEGKTVDTQAKTKALEDYDEYLNTPDNEKEEDLAKAAAEDDDSGMQADVTNTDYADDDNGDEDEAPADIFTTSTTTTTTTTTTTSTTTTPKPFMKQHYDYRDPRAYDSGTGAQYNGYQAKNDYPPMSPHSVHKWQSLGTREGVKQTRNNMQQYNKNGKSAEIREALQHAIKVNKEGSCQWPRARIIPVRDVYPSPSTTYIPHCAILHRCSDDTGCCRSEALTCVPKHSHRVELSFYTTNVGGTSVVEKLSFYNHTECECRERSEYDTTNEKLEQRVSRHYHSSSPPQNMKKLPPRKSCRCPSYFMPRMTLDGVCQCNCHENSEDCIKTRRGKAFFSITDRLCIQNNECAVPNCEFGEYLKWEGRCPRKRDTFDAIASSYRTSLNRFRS